MFHTKLNYQPALVLIAIISLLGRSSAFAAKNFSQNQTPFKSLVMRQKATHIESQNSNQESVALRSPIDIDYPIYETSTFSLGLRFKALKNPRLTKWSPTTFVMEASGTPLNAIKSGAFGEIEYMGILYHLYQVVFMSKSAHLVGGKRMDMELHVRGRPEPTKTVGANGKTELTYHQNDLVFVVFFEKSNPSVDYVELENAGLGSGMIKILPEYHADPNLCSLTLSTTFNLENIWNGWDKFTSYEGTTMEDPLNSELPIKPVTYLIMFQTLWISEQQLSEFSSHKIDYALVPKGENIKILSNFAAYHTFNLENLKQDAIMVKEKIEKLEKEKLKKIE